MEAGTGTTARRPLGITILAVLGILSGGFGILSSLLLLAGGAVLGASGDAGTGGMAMILGVLLLVVSVLQLAFGIGAWMLKPWAWTLGILSQGLWIVIALVYIFTGSSIASQAVSIIVSGVILYYLFRPDVKAAFNRS